MVKMCQTSFFTFLCFIMIFPVKAMEFRFPVACQIMGNCWITNHVDLDDRSGRVSDYMCGKKATDNNKSTHISLSSQKAVLQNMPVLASASGKVQVAGNVGGFCGTRVLIKHAKGWESSYCHLNPRTLTVRAGQAVQQGQIIGSIGTSGQTSWPHLSFATIRNGMVFDPFSGRTAIEGCSAKTQSLWVGGMNPPYEPAAVASAGFTVGHVPNSSILNGTAQTATAIRTATLQLSLWSLMMNLRVDDEITILIEAPDGKIFKEFKKTITKDSPYFPVNLSVLKKNIRWEAGDYKGTITIERRVNGNTIKSGRIVHLKLVDD
ncbi:MAG: hypothetical protein COB76_00550 [Alphaproteobacteria bacterium]|nr:MAG: hypothetical protein COB76_00550 [Alphaproteobacteria bacterium]